MYSESSLIHMFLIYLHASHQNVVLYELFDVQEACWALPLRFFFFSPLLRISNHDLQIEKKAHQSPNILNLKDSNFVQKVDGVKSEDNSYNLPTVFSRS